MGLKKTIKRVDRILGKKKRARAKKADALAKLLGKLKSKRRDLKERLEDTADSAQRRKLKRRIRATEMRLDKGRAELERIGRA